MKLSLKTSLYQPAGSFYAQLKDKLSALCKMMKIDEARIVVEKRAELSPRFRLSAHLVIPGPDILVESSDHTLGAALRKLEGLLYSRIEKKKLKQLHRSSGRCQKTSHRVCC